MKFIQPITVPGVTNQKKEKQKESSSFIWTSELVDQYVKALDNGEETNMPSPFYGNEEGMRLGNIRMDLTPEEVEEIRKCYKDPYYFANKYAYSMTDDGIIPIQLKDYQEEMFQSFHDNRFTILMASRQMGKTTAAAIYIAWYICFHIERNVLITGDVSSTAMEVMDRVKMIYLNLPFFIKPGINVNNVHSIKFDNGCKIDATSTTIKTGRGKTIHLLYADEFAHVDDHISEKFYQSIFPTISASKTSKMIITSTPYGPNLFYKLWTGALNKENPYNPLRIDYFRHPERDEKWAAMQRKAMADDDRFDVEYGLKFFTGSKALFDESKLAELNNKIEEYRFMQIPELHERNIDYSTLKWNTNFKILELTGNDQFVITIDLAGGEGGDYTVFNFFQLKFMTKEEIDALDSPTDYHDFFKIQQIAVFRDNQKTIDECAMILADIVMNYLGLDNCRFVLEENFKGEDFRNKFSKISEYKDQIHTEYFIKTRHNRASVKKKPGIKMREDNKPVYCNTLKNNVNRGKVIINELQTIREVSTFSRNDRGKWITETGNDDLAMSCVLLSPYMSTYDEIEDSKISSEFSEQLSTLVENFSEEDIKMIEEKLSQLPDDFFQFTKDRENEEEGFLSLYDSYGNLTSLFDPNIKNQTNQQEQGKRVVKDMSAFRSFYTK